MRIGRPLLLTTTGVGIVIGIYEGYRYAGGLVVLMLAMMSVIGVGVGLIVSTIRREKREEQAASEKRRDQP